MVQPGKMARGMELNFTREIRVVGWEFVLPGRSMREQWGWEHPRSTLP